MSWPDRCGSWALPRETGHSPVQFVPGHAGLCRAVLVAVDGFSAYLKAFQQSFLSSYKGDKGGRPWMYVWEEVAIVQVIKKRAQDTLTIQRCIAQGCAELVQRLLATSQGRGVINTAFIERLNATFRQHLACLVRRGRALARQVDTLEVGMYLVGCVYNFCSHHKSLRLKLWITECRVHWVQRTPAVADGLADHRWSVEEQLMFKVPSRLLYHPSPGADHPNWRLRPLPYSRVLSPPTSTLENR